MADALGRSCADWTCGHVVDNPDPAAPGVGLLCPECERTSWDLTCVRTGWCPFCQMFTTMPHPGE